MFVTCHDYNLEPMNPFLFVPVVPLVTRGVLVARFWQKMARVPAEAEQDREGNRSYIALLAGFSFTGLTVLLALPGTDVLAIVYVFVSFLSYLASLNLQSYKAGRWQDQLATALTDAGSLCLVLCVLLLLEHQVFVGHPRLRVFWVVALLWWIVDHLLRVWFMWGCVRDLVEED